MAKLTWLDPKPITIGGITPSSGAAPTLVVYKGVLYVLFATSNSSEPSLWQLAYTVEGGWTGNTGINFGGTGFPSSLCQPAAAVMKGVLYMAWMNQGSSDDTTGLSINIASLTATGSGPMSSTKWVALTNSNTAPLGYAGSIAMVAYPYKGVESLWTFYNNENVLCVAIAQVSGSSVKWVVEEKISSWTSSVTPQMSGGATAALFSYLDTATLTSYVAPFIVFNGSGSDNYLDYVYYDSITGQFAGNDHLRVLGRDIKISSTPCVIGMPRVGNAPPIGLLLYQGNVGNSIDATIYINNDWKGNVEISTISKKVGTGGPIDPTTQIGVGAAVYGPGLMMVYPNEGETSLYCAEATFASTN